MVEIKWPEWCCPTHLQPLSDRDDALFGRKDAVMRPGRDSPICRTWRICRIFRAAMEALPAIVGFVHGCDDFYGPFAERARRGALEPFGGQLVLEAGCGAGRFTEVLLKQKAKVVSVDLTEAVEANQENCPQGTGHRLAQADILQLPLARRQFDLVLCIGVIQHTPSPEKTIAALAEHVKEGGWLGDRSLGYPSRTYTKRRHVSQVLRRMPSQRRLALVYGIPREVFFPFHRMAKNFTPHRPWSVGSAPYCAISTICQALVTNSTANGPCWTPMIRSPIGTNIFAPATSSAVAWKKQGSRHPDRSG